MNKTLTLIIVVAILIGGGGFYAGLKYGQSKSSVAGRSVGTNFANLSPEERQQRMQQFGDGTGGQRRMLAGGGFASGEILAKDDTTITLKLQDGGSKIIFYATSTSLMKFSAGSSDDLKVGENVTITGTVNQDGSLTAESIQLRPQE